MYTKKKKKFFLKLEKKKITTRSIPMWSPTIVLTAPSPA